MQDRLHTPHARRSANGRVLRRAALGLLHIALAGYFLMTGGCAWTGGVVSQIAGNFASPEGAGIVAPFRGSGTARLAVQWVGHSTVLVRIDDRVIITDPFLTARVGEVKARLVEPGIDLDSLGRLDLILVSHAHADHLSLGSLGMLAERFPGTDLVFPAGVEEFLPRYTFPLVRMKQADRAAGELTGETVTLAGVAITTVFSRHWGGRYGLDGSVWGFPGYTGYIVEYHGLTVYYPGDTGYDPDLFREIGRRWAIDLALIPIGPCYDPASVGTPVHVGPLGAVRILEDTKACTMVPIHYGTVQEPMDPFDPLEVFLGLLKARPDLLGAVSILKIGELAEFFR